MPGGRLVLLTSADDYDSTRLLRSCLESWCRAGLLGLVAWARAADLARDAAGTDYAWADGRRWTLAPLSTVVSGGLAELWLVALRGAEWDPEAPGATATEEGALTELNRAGSDALCVVRAASRKSPEDEPITVVGVLTREDIERQAWW